MATEEKRTDVQQALIDLRTAKGWTQQQLAFRLKRAVVSVAKWETDKPPGVDVLEQLAKFADWHKLPSIAFRFRVAAAKRQGFEGAEAEFLFLYSVVLQNGHLHKIIGEESFAIHDLINRVLIKLKKAQESGEWVRGIDPSDLKRIGGMAQAIADGTAIPKKKEPKSSE